MLKLPKKTLFFVVVFLFYYTYKIIAQQDPQYTQYMFNTMAVNPAYAGSEDHTIITAVGRMQWVGVNGAPETQNLSYNTPLGYSGLGLGINLVNDKLGPSHEIYADGNLSYKIRTGYEGSLAFGLRLGARWLNIDWTLGLNNDNEDFPQVSKVLPTIGLGFFYNQPNWYIGLSAPNLLNTEHYDQKLPSGKVAIEKAHTFLTAGYVFTINSDFKLKPAILIKSVSGSPVSMDISANALFKEKFRIGMSWRWDDSISALLGLQINNSMLIGYAYDLTTSNYNIVNTGTHEILLQYNIFKDIKYRSVRFF